MGATLFDPVDPHLSGTDRARLRRKMGDLLAALRRGPQTNISLVPIVGMRVSARIHDLRRACGFDIKAENLGKGVWLFTLVS